MFKVLNTNNKKFELYNVVTLSDNELLNELQVYLRIQQAINNSLVYYYRMKPDANISGTFDFEYKSIFNIKKRTIETRLTNYYPEFENVNNELAEELSKLYSYDSSNFVNEFISNLDKKRTFRKIIKNGLLALKNELVNPEHNAKMTYLGEFLNCDSQKDLGFYGKDFTVLIDELSKLKTNQILNWFLEFELKLVNKIYDVEQFVFRNDRLNFLDEKFKLSISNMETLDVNYSLFKENDFSDKWFETKTKLNKNFVNTYLSVNKSDDLLLVEFSSKFYNWATRYLAMKIIREKYNLIYSPLTKDIFVGEVVLENTISNANVNKYKIALSEVIEELKQISTNNEFFCKFKKVILDEINNSILENSFFELFSMFTPKLFEYNYDDLVEKISSLKVDDLLSFNLRSTMYIKGSENGF